MSADKLFKKFFGRDAKTEFNLNIEDLTEVILIGEALAIEYKARKHEDKKEYIYRHEFKKGDYILAGHKTLVIIGDRLKITERGIEN